MLSRRIRFCFIIFLLILIIVYKYQFKLNSFATHWTNDWSDCFYNKFRNIQLIIVFNFPLYSHIPLLHSLYGKAFPNMVFCGTDNNTVFKITKANVSKGYFGYECLTNVLQNRSANYSGYLVVSDDILLNFWNLINKDQGKIWEGPKTPITVGKFSKAKKWYWWKSRWGLTNCQKAINETKMYQLMSNTIERNRIINSFCHGGRADVFYLPQRFAAKFVILADIFRINDVFIEIAVPTILRILDSSLNFELLNGLYLPGRVGTYPVSNNKHLWIHYSIDLDFIHPLKLHYGSNSTTNILMLKYYIQKKIDKLVSC